MNVILETGMLTDDLKKKIEDFAQRENMKVIIPKGDEEVKVLPKDIYSQKNAIQKVIVDKEREEVLSIIEKFFEEYAVDFKNAGVELPSYLTFHTDSEYDDNGGTYEYLSGVSLFDKDKKMINCDFEVEVYWGETSIEGALADELQVHIDMDNFYDMFEYGDYIKIPRGE